MSTTSDERREQTYDVGHRYLGESLNGSNEEALDDTANDPLFIALDVCAPYARALTVSTYLYTHSDDLQ